jgi:hypothetical protein
MKSTKSALGTLKTLGSIKNIVPLIWSLFRTNERSYLYVRKMTLILPSDAVATMTFSTLSRGSSRSYLKSTGGADSCWDSNTLNWFSLLITPYKLLSSYYLFSPSIFSTSIFGKLKLTIEIWWA